jgi:hypothetical protein
VVSPATTQEVAFAVERSMRGNKRIVLRMFHIQFHRSYVIFSCGGKK